MVSIISDYKKIGDDFYALVIENKVSICYNIGTRRKESVVNLRKLQEFWTKIQKFFANMYRNSE